MSEELCCPHCGAEMETVVCGYVEVTSDCYVPCKATCSMCDRKYKMFEVYTFVGYEEMEEIEQ